MDHLGKWLCFVFLCMMPLWAGEPTTAEDQVDSPELTLAETMTVSAELHPVKVKQTTAKVTVIEEQLIRRRVDNDLADLVKYEPGVYIPGGGSRLGLNGFNIRGMGGNRVLTQVDGVPTAHEFAFGPLAVHQIGLDVDTLKSVEILRGASSSLYGSNALGGVVSLATKDPVDYLQGWGEDHGLMVKTGYDGKRKGVDLGLTGAMRLGAMSFLVHATRRETEARDNQGTLDALDASRTSPNDQDGRSLQLLAKLVYERNAENRLRLTVEHFDNQVDTALYTGQGVFNDFGLTTEVADYRADDRQKRLRLSLDHRLRGLDLAVFDGILWRAFFQKNDTQQITSEQRTTALPMGALEILRTGQMTFEQEGYGADLVLRKALALARGDMLFTYGLSVARREFGQLRDRRDLDLVTGNPDAYAGTLIFPTRYFPNSTVAEQGAFVQLETHLLDGRLRLTPGLRYDRFSLSPDRNDPVYLESTGSDAPAGLDDGAASPKLGALVSMGENVSWAAHYGHGFRAPPYSSVNSGFTNLAGGYQSLPNPALKPEESDNLETSFRFHSEQGSLNLTWFDNHYDDFIADTQFVGMSPAGVALFQAQNLGRVRINGWEAAGDYRFSPQWFSRFSYADHEGKDRETGDPIESIQPEKLVLGLAWQERGKRYGGEVALTHVAAVGNQDVVAEDAFRPKAYTLLDLTLFYEVGRNLALHGGLFNLTDRTYYPFSDVRGRSADDATITRYSAPGRNFSANLRYRW